MHIHKWSKWEVYNFPVKRAYRGQVFDGIEEVQQRECAKCGLRRARAL